jgi:hypothetical protein
MDAHAPAAGSLHQDTWLGPPICGGLKASGTETLRGRSGLGVLALAGGGVFVFLVVLVITARPGGHTANAVELAIQILVLAGAVVLVAGRIVRRS